MDTILKMQQIVIETLEKYAKESSSEGNPLEFEVVADTKRNHFQLISLGWTPDGYEYHVAIHLDIKGGKIWVQRNMTEALVAQDLVAQGVPKSSIVLGLQPPEYRPYTGYATA